MSVSESSSDKMKITSRAPQGSLLRPRLFSIFTNDLPLSLDSNFEMFADDSTSYVTANSIDTISIQIQKLLDQLGINYTTGINAT